MIIPYMYLVSNMWCFQVYMVCMCAIWSFYDVIYTEFDANSSQFVLDFSSACINMVLL